MGTIGKHLRSNVVGYLALFIALGLGSASAAEHLIGTDDIENGAVTTSKIANEAVTNQKIAFGSVNTGRLAAGAVTSNKVKEIDDLFRAGQDSPTSCFADGGPELCTQTDVELPRSSRVLLAMTGNWYVSSFTALFSGDPDTNSARGNCSLTIDGADLAGTEVRVGERRVIAGATPSSSGLHHQSLARTALTPVLPTGNHTFGLRCNEISGDGDIDWTNMKVTALMVPGTGGSVFPAQAEAP
jgi:hypothetical protein